MNREEEAEEMSYRIAMIARSRQERIEKQSKKWSTQSDSRLATTYEKRLPSQVETAKRRAEGWGTNASLVSAEDSKGRGANPGRSNGSANASNGIARVETQVKDTRHGTDVLTDVELEALTVDEARFLFGSRAVRRNRAFHAAKDFAPILGVRYPSAAQATEFRRYIANIAIETPSASTPKETRGGLHSVGLVPTRTSSRLASLRSRKGVGRYTYLLACLCSPSKCVGSNQCFFDGLT